jgi:dipeptidase E
MKHLFLTSSIHHVAYDVVKHLDLKNGNKLIFINTPAETDDGDRLWLAKDRQALVHAGFAVNDYTITGKVRDQLMHDLKAADYIFVSGGDTSYLLQQSVKSGFTEVARDLVFNESTTYIGSSAGSIIAGPMLPDYLFEDASKIDTKSKRGFGFVDFTIVPHWGSSEFEDRYLNTRLKQVYTDGQTPLLTLTDSQYIHIVNNDLSIKHVHADRWR